MKTIFSLLTAIFLATTAHANDAYDNDFLSEEAFCEDGITLPTGYQFVHKTENCAYNENLSVVIKDNKYGYVNKKGEVLISPRFDEAFSFDDGLALIRQDDKYGYINPKGEIVIRPQFDNAWGFWDGRAKIAQDDKFGFIDKKGTIVIKPIYAETGDWFEYGLVRVKIGEKWGFIDKSGNIVIAPIYDQAEDFSEGLAMVGIKDDDDHKFGYIDPTGEFVIAPEYDIATNFIDGYAFVIKDDRAYYIDKTGTESQLSHQDP